MDSYEVILIRLEVASETPPPMTSYDSTALASICFSPNSTSHGLSWTPMDSYGLLWTPMDSYGLLWTLMDSYGLLWTPMDYVLFYLL